MHGYCPPHGNWIHVPRCELQQKHCRAHLSLVVAVGVWGYHRVLEPAEGVRKQWFTQHNKNVSQPIYLSNGYGVLICLGSSGKEVLR